MKSMGGRDGGREGEKYMDGKKSEKSQMGERSQEGKKLCILEIWSHVFLLIFAIY